MRCVVVDLISLLKMQCKKSPIWIGIFCACMVKVIRKLLFLIKNCIILAFLVVTSFRFRRAAAAISKIISIQMFQISEFNQ